MTISTIIADIETALKNATPGPWQVAITQHPYNAQARPPFPSATGKHIERRIFTTWDHPQSKSPDPVVTGSVGISGTPGKPVHMVRISEPDASYIVACNPANIRALLDHVSELERALTRLGSMEGFTSSFAVRDNNEGIELKARIDFARSALASHVTTDKRADG